MSSSNRILHQQKSLRSIATNSVACFITLVALLLLNAMASSPSIASEQTDAEHETVGVVNQGAAIKPKPAIAIVRGIVDGVDEANDTIKIGASPETSQLLKVQDGLIFNAVRFGDQVTVLVQEIAGAKTIVGLEKN
jgi:hypothetical protein